jgi:hypothetical protein
VERDIAKVIAILILQTRGEMTEAIIILAHMRGGCATVGDKVHALFRLNGPSKRERMRPSSAEGSEEIRQQSAQIVNS